MKTKALSFDLATTDLSKTGFWWCTACHRVTELRDQGEYNQSCLHCQSFRVKWCPPTEVPSAGCPVPNMKQALPQLEVRAGSVVDFSADALAKKKRLPMEKRDLRVLYQTGYFFCFGCLEVTELSQKDGCCLCASEDVRWQDGIDPKPNNQKERLHVETTVGSELGAADYCVALPDSGMDLRGGGVVAGAGCRLVGRGAGLAGGNGEARAGSAAGGRVLD